MGAEDSDGSNGVVVIQFLADGPSGRTDLVTVGGRGPFVRKRVPSELANPDAWLALKSISDPSLPHVESVVADGDCVAVMCDYVEGETVAEKVEAVGALPMADAVRIARGVCHAAGVLHAHEIIHRDIVPANVVIGPDGSVHLIDLGIARVHVDGVAKDTRQLGTWGFAPPEQYGFAQTDARSDVFSIGRLFAYMLTGITPDKESFAGALSDDRVVSPSARDLIERACAFEPSARHQSADELDRALEGLTQCTPPPPASPKTRAVPTSRQASGGRVVLSRIVAASGVATAIMMVCGAIIASSRYSPGGWQAFYCLYGVVCSLFFILAPAREIYRAILGTGRYESDGHAARTCALSILKWVGICLGIIAVLALVGLLLFGPNYIA